METYLDFETKLVEIDQRLAELKGIHKEGDDGLDNDIQKLKQKYNSTLNEIYSNLMPIDQVKIARHPERPHYLDYVNQLFEDYTPLAGDRKFGEDKALLGGIARFNGMSVVIMGQEKGHDTQSRMKHNFGSPNPEGYRKAKRLMELGDKYKIPVISLVDTAGAFPGIGAEERGQSEAIAACTQKCLQIKVPFVSTIIGEGGSGGAIAIAAANSVLMLENSMYSVISPEGCASILWKDASMSQQAAKELKITSADLMKFGVIDEIIKEPIGGAHRYKKETIKNVGEAIYKHITDLSAHDDETLLKLRKEKFLNMTR